MRRAAKRDEVEREIINGLRALPASVEQVSGKDVWDLIVGHERQTFLLEVKRPGKKASEGQAKLHARWLGGPSHVVDGLPAALVALGVPLHMAIPRRMDPDAVPAVGSGSALLRRKGA